MLCGQQIDDVPIAAVTPAFPDHIVFFDPPDHVSVWTSRPALYIGRRGAVVGAVAERLGAIAGREIDVEIHELPDEGPPDSSGVREPRLPAPGSPEVERIAELPGPSYG